MKMFLYALAILLSLNACNGTDHPQTEGGTNNPGASIPPIINFTILNTFPHDESYFTEGLEFYNEQLLESSGGNMENTPHPSAAGIVNLKTGKVDARILLDRAKYFGEGITVLNDKLYMLTWTSQVGFVYDAKTFKKISEFKLPTKQGWGLTHDSSSIIMSDGTNSLHYLDPITLQVKNILGVEDNNGPVGNINELEWVNGFIYANVYNTNFIVKIDPATGKLKGKLDLTTLVNMEKNKFSGSLQLNGIAYDAATDKIYVTGKMWPHIYEIQFEH